MGNGEVLKTSIATIVTRKYRSWKLIGPTQNVAVVVCVHFTLQYVLLWHSVVCNYISFCLIHLRIVVTKIYINKCPTRCNNMQSIFYSTAISLYMFRVPSTPIIRSTWNCSYSHRYKPYVCAATSLRRGQIWPCRSEVAARTYDLY